MQNHVLFTHLAIRTDVTPTLPGTFRDLNVPWWMNIARVWGVGWDLTVPWWIIIAWVRWVGRGLRVAWVSTYVIPSLSILSVGNLRSRVDCCCENNY